MIFIKNEKDIEKIRKAAAIWEQVKQALISATKSGISTKELDELANKVIVENGGIPTFFEYGGFPGYVCISVNDEILHGIGNERKLLPGDLVTYDIGVTYQNRICDSAFSMIVPGKENKEAEDILKATQACLEETVKAVKPGVTTGDLGFITEQTAKKYGYVVIKDFSGHGCGIKLHEEPMVFNYGKRGTGEVLKPGMVICIEPMLLTGSDQYTIDKANDWVVRSKNKKLTCHCEYIVLVTETGHEILNTNVRI